MTQHAPTIARAMPMHSTNPRRAGRITGSLQLNVGSPAEVPIRECLLVASAALAHLGGFSWLGGFPRGTGLPGVHRLHGGGTGYPLIDHDVPIRGEVG